MLWQDILPIPLPYQNANDKLSSSISWFEMNNIKLSFAAFYKSKIVSKTQLIENKEVTLLAQLNR